MRHLLVSTLLAFGVAGSGLLHSCGGGGGGGSSGANQVAPSNLSYATDFARYSKSVPIAVNTPTFNGQVTTWSVTPPLPQGLSIDPLSGVIAGTPTVVAADALYTVRAANAAGFTEVNVELGVVRPPNFVVAANGSDDTLSSYVVDASSGLLSPTGFAVSTRGADFPRGIAQHPNGATVYVANRASRDISIYDIDRESGHLYERETVAVLGNNPNEIVVHPTGEVLYVVARTLTHVQTFKIDALDGGLTSLGGLSLPNNGFESVLLDPQGEFMWVSNTNSNTIRTLVLDPVTKLPSDTGREIAAGGSPISMVLSRDRKFLYSCALTGNRVQAFTVDLLTGGLTQLQSLGTGALPSRAVLAPSGRFLYVAISSEDTIRTYSVDRKTGLLTQISATPTGDRPASLTMDPSGSFLYTSEINPPIAIDDLTSGEVGIFSVDFKTGALLRLEAMRARLEPVYLTVVQADEPVLPRPKFAFVANANSDSLSGFAVNAADGELSSTGTPQAIGDQPETIAAHPNGRWLYTVATSDDEIAGWSVDPLSGALTSLGTPIAVGDEPTAIAIESSGRSLYVLSRASSDVRLFAIDPITGALNLTAQAPIPAGSQSLAIDPSGRFVLVASPIAQSLTVFDSLSSLGILSEVPQSGTVSGPPSAISIHPNGRHLFATYASTGRIVAFVLDPAGHLIQVANRPSGLSPQAVAVHGKGRFLYVVNRDSSSVGDITIFRFDTSSNILTRVDEALAGQHPVAAIVDPSGKFLYVANEGSNDVTRLSINPSSGRLSQPVSTPVETAPSDIALINTLH